MALFFGTSLSSSFLNPKPLHLYSQSLSSKPNFLSFSSLFPQNPEFLRFPSLRCHSSLSGNQFNQDPEPKPDADPIPISGDTSTSSSPSITDDWGEKSEPEPETDDWGEKSEPEPETESSNIVDADPPKDEDEWGGSLEEDYVTMGNGSAAQGQGKAAVVAEEDGKVGDLKRCLVDSFYGTELGFRANPEVRAEILELVNQLEALNPTPAPVEASQLLDGNWVLLYTAFSELLPLLAAGATPLLQVKSISQTIDTSSLSIVNSTTLSSPFATFSFSASAEFEVRSPSRIQVEFKEGTLQPPEIKSTIDLPESIDVFGQKISLSPVQQSLNPLQEAVASISRALSGQPPLKLPIPGSRTASWLLITYLDEDLRISRGDGGLFVLAREGSPLLEQ